MNGDANFSVATVVLAKAQTIADHLREHANLWGLFRVWQVMGSRGEGELMAKLVWRVKLVAELEAGETVWSRDEVMRVDLIINADGLDFQASQMLWKGVFHFSALRCLAKL